MTKPHIIITSNFSAYKALPKTHRDNLRPAQQIDFCGLPKQEARRLMNKAKHDLRRSGWMVTDKRRTRKK